MTTRPRTVTIRSEFPRRKRILFAYPEVSPPFVNGGIGTFVYEAAHLLAGSGGWEVDVLTDATYGGAATRRGMPGAVRAFRAGGVRLLDLRRGWRGPLSRWIDRDRWRADRYLEAVSKLHAEDPYDVIETPDWRAPGYGIIRSKRERGAFRDVLLLVHLHSTTEDVQRWNAARPPSRPDRRIAVFERYVKAHADALLSPSRHLLARVPAAMDGSARPAIRRGYPAGPSAEPGTPSSFAGRRVLVACISRLEPRKGQDLLAMAMRELAAGADPPNVELVFRGVDNFGVPPDRRMSHSIRRILDGTPGWSIEPPADRSELRRWLTRVDICVVPSRGDNYPNVILEAAAAGCRVVCSDAGGIPELLEDYGIRAPVFPSGDAAALREALREAIASAPGDPAGRTARREAFERARRAQARRVLDAYESLAGTGHARKVGHRAGPAAEIRGDAAAPATTSRP